MKVRLRLEDRWSGGVYCPHPVVWLKVRDRYGMLVTIKFRVDTQADMTTFPVRVAEREAIPFEREREGTALGLVGSAKMYRGRISVVIAGREHDWPCDFIEEAVDSRTGQELRELTPVLGRAGFLRDYAIRIEGDYLTVTRLGPIRRWMRKCQEKLWKTFGLAHPKGQPL